MRMLMFIFISSLLVSSVLSCLVTSASDCPCGDIFDYAYNPEDMLYTKQAGCVQNITCPTHYLTNVFSRMNESEIPTPADFLKDSESFIFPTNLNRADPPGPAIDIFSYFDLKDIPHTKQIGCVQNITCLIDYLTSVYSRMNESEIPKPSNSSQEIQEFAFQTNSNVDDPPGPAIDIFPYFGMVCENNAWFATKYPTGITYLDFNEKLITIESYNQYNGRKSKIAYFSW
ncbi:unnamed protein product [Caenorhabditis brenneri]